jgi:GWxTD domain-containing protein
MIFQKVLANLRFTILIVVLILSSCGGGRNQLAGISSYESQKRIFNPSFKVYHLNDSISRVYFLIPSDDMLFVRNPKTKKFEADLDFNFKIISTKNDQKKIVDAGKFKIKKEEDFIPNNSHFGFFNLRIKKGEYYFADLGIYDNNKKKLNEKIITIDKITLLSEENFLLKDTLGQIKFKNFLDSGDLVKIESKRIKNEKLYLRYFPKDESYPLPIFIEDKVKDKEYVSLKAYEIKMDEYFSLSEEGIFLASSEPKSSKGVIILNFNDNYPSITDGRQMGPPMRYITSDKEFEIINRNPEKVKSEVEMLWARASKDLPRTQKLISTYFNRVEYSNYYFTTYKEGWRTDRGMVYTIFGPPNEIYKSSTKEYWMYGLKDSSLKVEFEFTKTRSPLSDNEYTLTRDKDLENIWKNAVEFWREGRVFDNKQIIKIQEEYDRQNRRRFNTWNPYFGY